MNDIKALLSQVYRYYSTDLNGDDNTLRKKLIAEKDIQYKEMLLKEIRDIAKGCAVVDWTDEDAACFEFKILLHRNQEILDDDIELIKKLNNIRYDLRVFISILGPYYYLFEEKTQFVEEQHKWIFTTIDNSSIIKESVYNKVARYFSEIGYNKIPEDIAKQKVLNIETEFKYKNEANIFDCLFTDLLSID